VREDGQFGLIAACAAGGQVIQIYFQMINWYRRGREEPVAHVLKVVLWSNFHNSQ